MIISWAYLLDGFQIIFQLRDGATQEYFLHWCDTWTALPSANQNQEIFFLNIITHSFIKIWNNCSRRFASKLKTWYDQLK